MANRAKTARSDPIFRKLRQTWRRRREFWALRGAALLVLWTAGLGAVDFLLDWLLDLPGWGRAVLLAVNLLLVARVAWREWLRHLRRFDPVRVALWVERRHPDLRSLLVSYVQLDEAAARRGRFSPDLVRAARRLALEATRPIDFRRLVRFRDLAGLGVACLAVSAAAFAAGAAWPEFAATLFYRLVNPTAEVRYPTRTRILSVTGSVTRPEGSPLRIEVRAEGVLPPAGALWVQTDDGRPQRIRLPRVGPGVYAHAVGRLTRTFRYRVRLGDDRAGPFAVRVVPAPHVVRTAVRLTYPAYTGLAAAEADSLHLDVPEGTRLAVTLTLDRPVRAAEVVDLGGGAAPEAPAPASSSPTAPYSIGADDSARGPAPGGEAEAAGHVPGEVPREPHEASAEAPAEAGSSAGPSPPSPASPRGPRGPMTVGPDGRTVSWTWTAPAPVGPQGITTSFGFRWTERDHGFAYRDPVHHVIRALPDAPPRVQVEDPSGFALAAGATAKATRFKRLPIRFRAEDDYGLAWARLVYRVGEGPERHLPPQPLEGTRASGGWLWTLREAVPDLKEGDVVTWAVEVADSRPAPAGPNRTRSEVRRLLIVSPEEYLRWVAEQRARLFEILRAARDEESESEARVKVLKEEAPLPSRHSPGGEGPGRE